MAEAAACLRALWECVEASGVDVRYLKANESAGWTDGRYFWAKPELCQPATIKVYSTEPVPAGPAESRDPVKDVITLAHECGHCVSDRHEHHDGTFRGARDKVDNGFRIDPVEAAIVLREERRAWTLAWRILNALGFEQWEAFRVESSTTLAT